MVDETASNWKQEDDKNGNDVSMMKVQRGDGRQRVRFVSQQLSGTLVRSIDWPALEHNGDFVHRSG